MRTITRSTVTLAIVVVLASPPAAGQLPHGTFQMVEPLYGRNCLAIGLSQIGHPARTRVRAWWWSRGDGDCSTTTSDVVSSNIDEWDPARHRLDLEYRLKTGGTCIDRVSLVPSGDSLVASLIATPESCARNLRADPPSSRQTRLRRVQGVDPTFVPVSAPWTQLLAPGTGPVP
jgi:hypothetical protein